MIKAYTLIVSFMPAISALSGNLGLQASANTIRGLGTGHIDQSKYFSNMWKEMKSGFLSATIIASTICLIGTLWAYTDGDNKEIIKRCIFLSAHISYLNTFNFSYLISSQRS